MKNIYQTFLKQPLQFRVLAAFALFALSCGNPIIEEEYDKLTTLGDKNLYNIAGPEDLIKLHAHPNGTFLFTSDQDMMIDQTVADEFTGKVQGVGKGALLVPGMLFKETKGAIIQNIVVKMNGKANGADYVGAIVGKAVDTQFIDVRIEGTSAVESAGTSGKNVIIGGIAGTMDGGGMSRCSIVVDVKAAQCSALFIGGLVGQNNGGEIIHSYAHSNIVAAKAASVIAGGIAGLNTGKISASYYAHSGGLSATTDDPAAQSLGGIAGENTGTIENCYSHAPSATENAGKGTAADKSLFDSSGSNLADKSKYPFDPMDNWYFDLKSGGPYARLINNPDFGFDSW